MRCLCDAIYRSVDLANSQLGQLVLKKAVLQGKPVENKFSKRYEGPLGIVTVNENDVTTCTDLTEGSLSERTILN